jgi:hypothetical protein
MAQDIDRLHPETALVCTCFGPCQAKILANSSQVSDPKQHRVLFKAMESPLEFSILKLEGNVGAEALDLQP